jgi:hypothetical protein
LDQIVINSRTRSRLSSGPRARTSAGRAPSIAEPRAGWTSHAAGRISVLPLRARSRGISGAARVTRTERSPLQSVCDKRNTYAVGLRWVGAAAVWLHQHLGHVPTRGLSAARDNMTTRQRYTRGWRARSYKLGPRESTTESRGHAGESAQQACERFAQQVAAGRHCTSSRGLRRNDVASAAPAAGNMMMFWHFCETATATKMGAGEVH